MHLPPRCDAEVERALTDVTKDTIRSFEDYASLCEAIQQRVVELEHEAEQGKTLRQFPTREAAALLGISDSYLRRLVIEEPDLALGALLGNNQRVFRLDEIHKIRSFLLGRSGDARYRPGRRKGNKLQIISFSNFKGGAAKTTTAVHFAQYIAMRGYRVLLLDLDSQASATSMFGYNPDEAFADKDTLYTFFRGECASIADLVRPTYWPGLDLIPANLGLYKVEFELPARQLNDKRLRFWRLLADGLQDLEQVFDVVICDCPPSLGYLSINALFASTGLIVTVPPSMLDFSSTGRFFKMMAETLNHIASFEGANSHHLDFANVLVTRFKPHDRNQERIAAWMTTTFGDRLLHHRMPQTTALDAAGAAKETLYERQAARSRRSQERALEHVNAVNAEIEALILQQWGRATRPNRQEAA